MVFNGFNPHPELRDRHAFLSPSTPHWHNYTPDKLLERFDKHMNAALGTRLHAFAAEAISLGFKAPDNTKTINMYINDCIGYGMSPEKTLFYSGNAFGTADAVSFDQLTQTLRIFDLKNGETPSKEAQLKTYAALFCLEYKYRPAEIGYDLRFYQYDDVIEFHTDPEEIAYIMSIIKDHDKLLEQAKKEV